ncbi:unnamed protein product [Caenorhabditis nigoni]
MGAHVDNYRSSSSNLNRGNGFGYDQTDLVLIDRPEPPADKAWCSNSENPVLTIKLAKYIKPISVSYQHSKWHGAIPNGAPKTYDVVACLDCNEERWEPLALNCQYSQYESNGKEQMCNISSHFDLPLIREVQFRFRKTMETRTGLVLTWFAFMERRTHQRRKTAMFSIRTIAAPSVLNVVRNV